MAVRCFLFDEQVSLNTGLRFCAEEIDSAEQNPPARL